MDMYKPKYTSLERQIFELLCLRAGEELSQREIAKILDVSPTAVANSLVKLYKSDLLKIKKAKTINFVSLNRENRIALELKRVENLKNIFLSGIIKYLEKEFAGATIIMFGSFSFGEDTSSSDIDLAIIGRKDKLVKIEKYEKILNRKITLNFYNSLKKVHKNLRENVLNGIILSGGIEL